MVEVLRIAVILVAHLANELACAARFGMDAARGLALPARTGAPAGAVGAPRLDGAGPAAG